MDKKSEQAKAYILNIVSTSQPGTKIPSERELMAHLNFSRPTIQKAISDLLLEGYLYKVNRIGTFAADYRQRLPLNHLLSFSESARVKNTVIKTTLLESAPMEANEFLSYKMHCPIATEMHYFLRLRKYGELSVSLEYSYYTDFAVKNLSLEQAKDSIYQYIEEVNHLPIGSSDITIQAVLPEEEIAAALEVSSTEPLLMFEQLSRLKDGRIFEYTISYTVSRYTQVVVNSIR